MAVFLGTTGNIRLRRRSSNSVGAFSDEIVADDVNTLLARVGFSKSIDNLVTGDRVEITTTDPRGLICLDASSWDSGVIENSVLAYVNVNALGGLRFFDKFEDAVNNTRAKEYTVTAFSGDPIPVSVTVRDLSTNVLGNVTDFELNTTRENVETTALSDRFRNQFSAGVISGSGRINCLFDYKSTGISEVPILLMQTVQRLDIGSSIDLALYLVDRSNTPQETSVFYEFEAVITQAGISVTAGDVVSCSVDFLTTGEIKLLVGEPQGYVLKEDDDRLQLQQSLDFLLQETLD